jgi:ribose 5-phosphate isomerase B
MAVEGESMGCVAMNILIASDHAGFELKSSLKQYLQDSGYRVEDLGASDDNRVDYPDYAHKLCEKLSAQDVGILICGSGIGMSIAANRYKHVRAALCFNTEYAKLARMHNDANVLVLGARFTKSPEAIDMVKIFLNTQFEGDRHQQRVDKLYQISD